MGFRVWGLGFRVWGLGFRVWGLGFKGLHNKEEKNRVSVAVIYYNFWDLGVYRV